MAVPSTDFVTKDSGQRIEFETGSRRDTNAGKYRFDLIGQWLLVRLSRLLERGAEKYTENNWKLGQPVSRSYESMFRHMQQWRMGERDEDHLAAVVFNAMSIMHVEEQSRLGRLPKTLMDIDFTSG